MQLSSACGEQVLPVTGRTTEELILFSMDAAKSGAVLILSEAQSMSFEDLQKIAKAGKGHVLFDLR